MLRTSNEIRAFEDGMLLGVRKRIDTKGNAIYEHAKNAKAHEAKT
jgi:hypothetical protein